MSDLKDGEGAVLLEPLQEDLEGVAVDPVTGEVQVGQGGRRHEHLLKGPTPLHVKPIPRQVKGGERAIILGRYLL